MIDVILSAVVLIPLYAVLIWSYLNPKESVLWGKRWMYNEEPEVSKDAVRYIKTVSLCSLIGLTVLLILFAITQSR